MLVTIDFETRSAVNIKVGPHRYAEDPSTEVMCLSWGYEGNEEVWLWHPTFPGAGLNERVWYKDQPGDVMTPLMYQHGLDAVRGVQQRIHSGALFEAHNAMFEQCIWLEIMVKRFGWPEIPLRQWRCSAAMAASFSLPRKLEHAVEALQLSVRKDMEGSRLMKRLAKPRAPLKADRVAIAEALGLSSWQKVPKPAGSDMFDLIRWVRANSEDAYTDLILDGRLHPWHEKLEDLERLFEYNMQDVATEKALSEQLRPLSDYEQEVWFLDQEMNHTGIHCDLALVEKALEISEDVLAAAHERITELTDGAVTRISQRQKLLDWINAQQGTQLPNMQKATLKEALKMEDRFTEASYEALLLRISTAKTSTKKYATMLASCCKDGRIRDLLAYWGADTGRWAGRGVQPQNFPRGDTKNMMRFVQDGEGGYNVKKWFNMDVGCSDVMEYGNRYDIDLMYGDTMELLSSCLRGAMTAAPGYELVAADYSAIEARGVFWLAGDERALGVFRQGRDIYLDQCAAIWERPYETFSKDDPERQVGKQAVLGLGYQMAEKKFQTTCEGYDINLDLKFCLQVKKAYRELHKPVADFWADIEEHAVEAVRRGNEAAPVEFRNMRFATRGRFLYMKLPSGRLLAYFDPSVAMEKKTIEIARLIVNEATGEEELHYFEKETERLSLRYWGMNSQTRQWCRQHTYGGKLTENAVQALSRDLMADAMLRLRDTIYKPILTVHDEVVAEVPAGQGSVEELERLLSQLPAWADGFPLTAEGWRGVRYRK